MEVIGWAKVITFDLARVTVKSVTATMNEKKIIIM